MESKTWFETTPNYHNSMRVASTLLPTLKALTLKQCFNFTNSFLWAEKCFYVWLSDFCSLFKVTNILGSINRDLEIGLCSKLFMQLSCNMESKPRIEPTPNDHNSMRVASTLLTTLKALTLKQLFNFTNSFLWAEKHFYVRPSDFRSLLKVMSFGPLIMAS